MYCITHGKEDVLMDNRHGWHFVGWVEDTVMVCIGPFASCPPPELEEDWHLHLTPLTPKEFQAMELNARELEMDFA